MCPPALLAESATVKCQFHPQHPGVRVPAIAPRSGLKNNESEYDPPAMPNSLLGRFAPNTQRRDSRSFTGFHRFHCYQPLEPLMDKPQGNNNAS